MVKRRRRAALLSLLLVGGCAAEPIAPETSGETPGPGAERFTIVLPIQLADTGQAMYGLWPFGVHGGGHASDGHPGWDIEFRVGRKVRAAAAGVVQSVLAEPETPDRVTIQIQHSVGGKAYRTVYTNLVSVAAGVAPGAPIAEGQVLATAGALTLRVGTRTVTFAMTHFQVDDFSQRAGSSNEHAINPYAVLREGARPVLDAIWSQAAYNQELT
ncbi:MAG: M23 family metallopeptidase, partial [Gemmatimonadetes bacterium]|nr:M23 family metallopeptidase [Gemmatimonadota bacterium]